MNPYNDEEREYIEMCIEALKRAKEDDLFLIRFIVNELAEHEIEQLQGMLSLTNEEIIYLDIWLPDYWAGTIIEDNLLEKRGLLLRERVERTGD